MVTSSLRGVLSDPETRGFILGIVSSITSSVITLYVVQHYLVQKVSTEAAKKAITDYKKEFGIMSMNWEPLSDSIIYRITEITNSQRI